MNEKKPLEWVDVTEPIIASPWVREVVEAQKKWMLETVALIEGKPADNGG